MTPLANSTIWLKITNTELHKFFSQNKKMEYFLFHPMKLNIDYEANITLVIFTELSQEN